MSLRYDAQLTIWPNSDQFNQFGQKDFSGHNNPNADYKVTFTVQIVECCCICFIFNFEFVRRALFGILPKSVKCVFSTFLANIRDKSSQAMLSPLCPNLPDYQNLLILGRFKNCFGDRRLKTGQRGIEKAKPLIAIQKVWNLKCNTFPSLAKLLFYSWAFSSIVCIVQSVGWMVGIWSGRCVFYVSSLLRYWLKTQTCSG